MKHNIRLPYVFLSLTLLIAGGAAAVLLFLLLFSPGPAAALSPEETAILSRTAERTGTQAAADIWGRELSAGQLTLSEYVRVSFTGTQYLLAAKDDASFAADLSYAVYGSEDKAGELQTELAGNSRVYTIEKTLRSLDASFAPASSDAVSDPLGTQVLSVELNQSLQDEEGYAFGIRKVSGTISISGDQARTDFYIDGNLRPGQLSVSGDAAGVRNFSLAWDTRSEVPGSHSVKVLLRTSDGRARILTGGDVVIPSFYTLVNDGVQKGSIPVGTSDVWYQLNAADRNAYINFVDLSGDIQVALYDMYGNLVGNNDLPGTQTEVLRGARQALPEDDTEDPYTNAYSNMYYARVRKGAGETSADEITYLMVQSKEVAVDADENYLAVVSDVGAVPTPVPVSAVSDEAKSEPVACKDLSGNSVSYARSDLTFLPINGRLASLSLSDPATAQTLSYYPEFDSAADSYAYVSANQISSILTGLTCVEGYAASVRIEQEAESGIVTPASADGTVAVTPSGNIIRIYVTDFDKTVHTYTIYLLSGTDSKGYDAATLNLFPDSYRSGIWLLHNLQPGYQFIPYETGISWTELLAAEDNKDRSLTDGTYPEWVKEDSPVYDGTTWRAAKNEVVSYFLDPRNFLDPVYVFQFEKLSFNPAVHTIEGVRAMVKGSFLASADPDYAAILLSAGQEAGISPYFLASRILQEMGRDGKSLLSSGTLPGYEGYFNFYNIGSTPDPDVENGALINGAKYAMWGADASTKVLTDEEKALLLPWTSPELAIRGGALWIASRYVDLSQDTLYFQKFDVINNEDGLYQHQYAQNISMAYSEGARYHEAYLSQNMLGSAFVFSIPVYLDMPAEYGTLPAENKA